MIFEQPLYDICNSILYPLESLNKLKNRQLIYLPYKSLIKSSIDDTLIIKLNKIGIKTYEDLIKYDPGLLISQFSKEELLKLFSSTLPVLDPFLDNGKLRSIICESAIFNINSFSGNFDIAKIVFSLLIYNKIDPSYSKVFSNVLDIYYEYYLFFFVRFTRFHDKWTNLYVFKKIYSSLSKEEKIRFKPIIDFFETIFYKKIYIQKFKNAFKITRKDILDYASFLDNERKQDKSLNHIKPTEDNKRNRMFKSNEFVVSLFENNLINESDLKFLLNKDELDLYNSFKSLKI